MSNLLNKNHPKYEPEKWNKDILIKKSHNCYAYALNLINHRNKELCKKYMLKNKIQNCLHVRPQPGQYSGYLDEYQPIFVSCDKIIRRMKKDNPMIKKLREKEECKDGYYKIALTCKEDGTDYHFYRQDNNGLWSHKDSYKKATNKDSKRRIIKDPLFADRGKYKIFCGYFSVPNEAKYKHMSNLTRYSKKYSNKISKVRELLYN
jgi:hypothetical protein